MSRFGGIEPRSSGEYKGGELAAQRLQRALALDVVLAKRTNRQPPAFFANLVEDLTAPR
jgi:hypothetical protein